MVKPTGPRSMLLNSEIKTVPSDCICGKIAKKTRPPEKEKNIAKMPAKFIGKACCGGDKKWGDGRGAGRAPNILTTTLPRLRQTPSENAD